MFTCLLKILHIHDQVAVACSLAKYQRMNGIQTKVLSSNKNDKYGILTFYKDYVDLFDRFNFAEYCLSEAKMGYINLRKYYYHLLYYLNRIILCYYSIIVH